MYKYRAYNKNILSPINLDIVGFTPASFSKEDITISIRKLKTNDRIPKTSYSIGNSFSHFYKKDKLLAFITNGEKIEIIKLDNMSNYEIGVYLINFPMALILSQCGMLVIHSSAVEYNGKVMLFAGQSHAGKSTLAAYFLKNGGKLISEDITAMNINSKEILILPSPSMIKLSSNAAKLTGLSELRVKKDQNMEREIYLIDNNLPYSFVPDFCFFLEWGDKNSIESLDAKSSLVNFLKFTFVNYVSTHHQAKILKAIGGINCLKLRQKKGLNDIENIFKMIRQMIG